MAIGTSMTAGQFLPSVIGEGSSLIKKEAPAAAASEGGRSFTDTLKDTLEGVNNMQLKADSATRSFASGGDVNLHDVMISMEKAEVALRTVTSVRNKLVEAYQEIMRMPV